MQNIYFYILLIVNLFSYNTIDSNKPIALKAYEEGDGYETNSSLFPPECIFSREINVSPRNWHVRSNLHDSLAYAVFDKDDIRSYLGSYDGIKLQVVKIGNRYNFMMSHVNADGLTASVDIQLGRFPCPITCQESNSLVKKYSNGYYSLFCKEHINTILDLDGNYICFRFLNNYSLIGVYDVQRSWFDNNHRNASGRTIYISDFTNQ